MMDFRQKYLSTSECVTGASEARINVKKTPANSAAGINIYSISAYMTLIRYKSYMPYTV